MAWLTALVLFCLPVLAEDGPPPAPPTAAEMGPKPKAIEPPAPCEVEQSDSPRRSRFC